ncbi:O-acetyl-ADP-ribose deacetylase [Nissabacter sp. SGAir0207]|uniref:O-acetyl-ADP-ribose deacetylase n=1 Tax=Nissabacter sp. SGAir0207 TaxID=2126321 RepID=UPI0010CCBFE2|nr:O-acetyl-ADP-ribose deacetylase [Nissabacter sp. SGAir0207]QCR36087.1 O-acetyl-ADP-ribose deacetylase [Nissabacter sp. SGAir0207]
MNDRIGVLSGDITRLEIDAIVNAANSSLLGGGGVDGAIHHAGGPEILEACKRIGGCKTGDAVITRGGQLPAKWVIHAVGPRWQGGDRGEMDLLRSAYLRCFDLAAEYGIRRLAFPNISTGIYGFPKQAAAEIAIDVTRTVLSSNTTIEEVLFICFDAENEAIYRELLDQPGAQT